MKLQTITRPMPPMPALILETVSQKYFQLPTGQVQIITQGEPPQTITKAAYERIAQIFSR